MKALYAVRSALFYVGFYLITIVVSSLSLLLVSKANYETRFRWVTTANQAYVWWLRVSCGVKLKLEGMENLPPQPYVLVANHQSELETLFLPALIRPQATVLKKELIDIPLFGSALALLDPIALDRSKKRGALKQLLVEGKERLGRGISIVIFPQGTRVPVGELGRFNKGGAMLAVSNKVPLVPMVHNAGVYWQSKTFIKYPGEVIVRVGQPMLPEERSIDELHDEMEQWIVAQMESIPSALPNR